MARLAPFRPVGDRNDLSIPKGAPVRGGLYDADAFGRFSEGLARFLGTGKYLFGQTLFVICWIILNTIGIIRHWDPYPFILLNLAFSTQAAYAAPLILLAQNRQDERDRATTERDRQVAARTQADTEYLARELAAIRLTLNDVVTNQDLAEHLEHLAKLIGDQSPEKPDEELTGPQGGREAGRPGETGPRRDAVRVQGAMAARRVVLVHGAATTSRVWRHLIPLLEAGALTVAAPDRPCTGDLAAETAALRPACAGAVVAGVSGGATLGLALAAAGVPAAAVLHEPAVGSLLPGLLDRVRAAYAEGGVPAFARALYGPAWTAAEAPADPGAVPRDLAMFTSFEPAAPAHGADRVIITVGERSPEIRHEAAARLAGKFGFSVEVIAGAGHAVHLTHPAAFAAVVSRTAARFG